jgi:hypothetical protein
MTESYDESYILKLVVLQWSILAVYVSTKLSSASFENFIPPIEF